MSADALQQSDGGGQSRTTEPDESLSKDDVFELLSNQRRRLTLHHLKHREEAADLGTLSEHVAAWENETSMETISSTERKRVYTSLQQFHLPKMDEKGVVDFDEREGTVELSRQADELDLYLEVVDSRDIPWSQYYLGLSAVNLALLTAALVNAYPVSLLPIESWAVFAITTFLISALVHTYFNRSEMRLGTDNEPPELGD